MSAVNPVWNIAEPVFATLVVVSVALLVVSIVAILVVLVREVRKNRVW